MKWICNFLIIVSLGYLGCQSGGELSAVDIGEKSVVNGVEIIVLGTAQDAGAPHIGCQKSCCTTLRAQSRSHPVSCLGIIDHDTQQYYLIDATPDMPEQIEEIRKHLSWESENVPDGIFITHAHIGHYTGLMYFGKEALGAKDVIVYAMPRMSAFLKNDGPWSQLVDLNNIQILSLRNDSLIQLSNGLSIRPFKVPHRDEFSETVGYSITSNESKVIFIPDIDKWHLWEHDIVAQVKDADIAFLDASFYSTAELSHRNADEIPHPLVTESMDQFKNQSIQTKNKIHFIHLNHTNPILNPESEETEYVISQGYNIARFKEKHQL